MVSNGRAPQNPRLWAYAYEISLPRDPRLTSIQELLDRGHQEPAPDTGRWAGQMVVEPQVIRILVVSDSPDLDGEVNRELEKGLTAMKAKFSVTVPMPVHLPELIPRTRAP